jgi:branched-chain amino acid transport system permease protein
VFNLLTGFIAPDSGSVILNGEEIVGKTPDAIARLGVARSFQDVRLFGRLTCLQNVTMAVPGQRGERFERLWYPGAGTGEDELEARAKAMSWLHFVGLSHLAEACASDIGYGEAKLVALARVLATEAAVLLLDEPASGIDTQWVERMKESIFKVRDAGRTVCLVEHNLHVVEALADRAYFMELGRITAEGSIAELTADPRLGEVYFGGN